MLARDLTTKRYLFGKCSRMLGPGLLVILIILPIQVGRMAWGCSVRLLSLVHARNSDLVSVGRYPTYQNTSRTVGVGAYCRSTLSTSFRRGHFYNRRRRRLAAPHGRWCRKWVTTFTIISLPSHPRSLHNHHNQCYLCTHPTIQAERATPATNSHTCPTKPHATGVPCQ
jgi:hypothetical protein